MNMNKDEYKEDERKFNSSLNWLIIIIVLVLIILTLGWFVSQSNKSEGQKESEEDQNAKREKEEKEKRELYLKDEIRKLEIHKSGIENKISTLTARKEEIKRTERKLFISTRLVLAGLLIILNIICFYFSDKKAPLNDLLNVNEAVLLGYSFLAFITYGTPSNFVRKLKAKMISYLSDHHFDTVMELGLQEKALIEITHEINQLNIELINLTTGTMKQLN